MREPRRDRRGWRIFTSGEATVPVFIFHIRFGSGRVAEPSCVRQVLQIEIRHLHRGSGRRFVVTSSGDPQSPSSFSLDAQEFDGILVGDGHRVEASKENALASMSDARHAQVPVICLRQAMTLDQNVPTALNGLAVPPGIFVICQEIMNSQRPRRAAVWAASSK